MTMVISRRRLLAGGAAALVGTVSAAACAGGERSRPGSAVEKVTVLTGAGIQGREAPIFVAQAEGWFRDEGIDVQVLPGKGSTENLRLLAGGEVVFATVDVNAAMIEYSKPGGISDVVLTSVLHQRNLACFVALRSSGINRPSDLAGRRLSYVPGGINHVLFPTYARLAGFDHSTIEWVSNPVPAQHAALLAAGKVDAASQFVPAVDSVRQLAGQEITVLPFADWIGDLHGSAIAVTTTTAREKPDLVRRFNRALLRGLRHAVDQPDLAGQIYAAQDETQGQQAATATSELQGLRGYVEPLGDYPFGHFDEGRVARNIAILQGAGAIRPGLMPQDIVAFDLAE
ncbi:ABC transporter substrate-binding protein [Solwaraspora sp. WMMD1047]|uniref:ABC transporter substrate-binding protein n=1 Tax=Solwaraspora sp. WMMD1047 TaxID=3016102 RepID=UPI002417C023|nr:ABC transporter substrate-binding protein [Solwaraspora sp. WMMD1047]MDG4834848.1 ABC transporter substrate-binding protein [Solwaraspora sp. WMMD1047]